MNRNTVKAFNAAYAAAEPTKAEARLISDLLTVWGKLDAAAAKHPAQLRNGIAFGMALQKAIAAGIVELPKVRAERKENKPKESKIEGTAEE